jgi:DNA-binding HxlR family transcriptional regulator
MPMRNSDLSCSVCPVARTLARVGDVWSLLILRDAFLGRTRFDEFRRSLGVASNILTDRLTRLVEAGLLERRRYSERPPRDEYVLTATGRDLQGVMDALKDFGERNFALEPSAT